jgi:hypothetical protein
MMDTRQFDILADRYQAQSEALAGLRIELANEAVAIYNQGVKIGYITQALNISVATVYNWLAAATKEGTVTMRRAGRPRKHKDPLFTPDPNPLPKLADAYEFAWLDDKVRVDSGSKRVLIDAERIEFEGDKDLGQLLVSGTDTNLIKKFTKFVNGK